MCHAYCFIRSLGERHLWPRPSPSLIVEFLRLQTDAVVELGDEAIWRMKLINGRALVCDQPLAIHQELILFRFTTEDRMVLKNQALHSWVRLPLEKQCSGKPTDSTTNDDAIVSLAGLN